MLSAPIQWLIERLVAPSSSTDARAQFSAAVRQMLLLLVLCALANGAGLLLLDAATPTDAAVLLAAAALLACTYVRAESYRRAIDETVIAGSIIVIGAGMYAGFGAIRGEETGALLLLLAWPILLSAYYSRLPVAMGSVGLAILVVGLAGLAEQTLAVASMRGVVVAVVFGTVVPLISTVRMRSEMSVSYLQDAVIRDSLTGLLNRRGFEQALRNAAAADRHVAILVADVDYFKLVNDRFGHARGDDVLTEVSTILFLEAPEHALVARIGGEEFGIMLEGASAPEALLLAEHMRRCVEQAFRTTATHLTLSVGAVATDTCEGGVGELLRQADQALYAAKSLGRNRAVAYSDDVLEILEQHRVRQEEASRTQLATLLTLAEALDLRDQSTAAHSRTVADYAEGMARELGLDEALVERIRLAGLLHDIGKIGVPDSVLLHPGKLDDEQWARMRQHPEIGARMLNHVDYTDIRDWVIAHHERPDGRGYPYGIEGESIPLGARILAVADSYEAMTADRVYRQAPGHEHAISELHKWSGAQFDADVVAAMITYLHATGAAHPQLDALAERRASSAEDDGLETLAA